MNKKPLSQEEKEVRKAMISEDGFISQQFDVETDVIEKAEVKKPSNEEGVEVIYDFTAEEVNEGIKLFQRKTVYQRNIFFTFVLGSLNLLYIWHIVEGDPAPFYPIISVVNVVIIAMIWLLQRYHRKKVVNVLKLQQDPKSYHMTFYNEGIKIDNHGGILAADDTNLEFWETDQLLVISYMKKYIFVLPYRCFVKQKQAVLNYIEAHRKAKEKRMA